jgi:hypothetical protein
MRGAPKLMMRGVWRSGMVNTAVRAAGVPCHKSALRWGGKTGKHCAALEPEHHWGASLSGMLGASAQLMASGWADRSERCSQAGSEAGRVPEATTSSVAAHSSEATTASWPWILDSEE